MSENNEKKIHGIVAEYTSVDTLLDACHRVREAGYVKTDAFTPFPVHGIDKALGIKPTVLPWIVLGAGLTGTVTALVMQIWMNAIDYPYIISGKPYISLPAFMPVAFELTVLFASFGAFFGMWALNGLPKFSNPVFTDPRFDRVTDDRFFLFIDSKDDRFEAAGVKNLLGDTETDYIESVVDDESSDKVPKPVFLIWGLMVAFSVFPLLIVLKMRVTNSEKPRFHVFYDMDFSPAKDAQQESTLFSDGRAMRPDVPGTISRGQVGQDLDFMTGIDIDKLSVVDPPRAERLVRTFDPLGQEEGAADEDDDKAAEKSAEKDADESPAKDDAAEASEADEKAGQDSNPSDSEKAAEDSAAKQSAEESDASGAEATDAKGSETSDVEVTLAEPAPSVMDTTPWLTKNPLDVDMELVERGQKYFGIYCSVCHGMNGGGNGLVNRRARKILAQKWIPPSSLHQDTLYADKYPDGKLFSTISNGIRKMPGYAGQIRARDRWAIVAYVRALQKSQNASIDQVPGDRRGEILAEQTEIEKQLKEQAAAEKKAEEERAKREAT
ncbi:MAG: quinol:electron acceptor oxidoreductase subunit ActD [Rubripirellula sp.]